MAVVISPSGTISVPDATPLAIRRALEVTSARCCRFTSELSGTKYGEYAIDADICTARYRVGADRDPWFSVRFLIPPGFPRELVHTVPLKPQLRWYPHQNGDWPLEYDAHANVMCPPSLHKIFTDELLLPYIRHAYSWISAALAGRLTAEDQRYEMPHFVERADRPIVVYIEGGDANFAWVRAAKAGIADMCQIQKSALGNIELYRATSLFADGRSGPEAQWRSTVRPNAFGPENEAGVAPWVYAGSPVVDSPHRAPQVWADLPQDTQHRILDAMRLASRLDDPIPLLLLAFGVPKFWRGAKESIVWAAVQLKQWEPNAFQLPHGFRANHPEEWPKVQTIIEENKTLRWIRACRDVSSQALLSRSASQPQPMTHLRVGLIGVGALGSALAKSIAKLEPIDFVMIDSEHIEPGNLVRHEASAISVESYKAQDLAELLQPVHVNRTVRALTLNVLAEWEKTVQVLSNCDLVIDASGNAGVHSRLADEPRLADTRLVWCYIKPGPSFGFLALRVPHSKMTASSALEALRAELTPDVWAEFETKSEADEGIVWPTPGCYHPTFDAAYHGIRLMADEMLTVLLDWLADDVVTDVVTLLAQERRASRYGVDQRILEQIRMTP